MTTNQNTAPAAQSVEDLINGYAINTIEATNLMLSNHLYGQLMIIIYSTIDALGLLDAPPTKVEADNVTFKSWVKKYLLPQDPSLTFSETDMWGARCGVLHTFTAQSRLSGQGNAKQIVYYSGDKSGPGAQQLLAFVQAQSATHVAAHIEDTLMAFLNGIKAFAPDLTAKCKADPKVEARLRNVLQQYFVPDA